MQELLKYSKDFLSAVDETIKLTPVNASASAKQNALRFLFMDSRSAAYDMSVLVESLLNNDRHHFPLAIERFKKATVGGYDRLISIFQGAEHSVAKQSCGLCAR